VLGIALAAAERGLARGPLAKFGGFLIAIAKKA
jgi:hypothetical protein